MPFPKKNEIADFEDEEVCGCPYDYSEEMQQLENVSKKKLKKVK